MKSKKGLISFGLLPIIYLVLVLGILGLLVWFGFRISDGLSAIIDFIIDYKWWLLGAVILAVFHKQVLAILNFVLSKVGVKI